MVKIQSSGAIQTFQHLGTHLPLTAVGEGGDFQQVIAASLNKQAGHPSALSVQVLLCKSFYSFQTQNPSKISNSTFLLFFRIFSLQNPPKDILLSKLHCVGLSTD